MSTTSILVLILHVLLARVPSVRVTYCVGILRKEVGLVIVNMGVFTHRLTDIIANDFNVPHKFSLLFIRLS